MVYDIKNGSTGTPLYFLMVKSSDHITGLTGASPTVTICKNAGSFGSPSGAVTEVANGWYKVAGNATDTNTNGPLLLHATATNGDPTDCIVANIVAYDPADAVHLGISALPNTACTTNASLFTSGTGTDQISASAGKLLLQATQSGVTIPTVTTVTNQLTAAAIATGIFQDTTAGDFTAANSIGKSIMNGVALGTGLTVNNLTNAPTNGDLTATMKTSVTTACTASTPTALITAGTGTGQLDVTSGVIKANLAQILGTALTETAGQIAAAFKKFFNIATPAATMDHLILVDTVTTATTATNLTNAPTNGDLTAAMKTSVTTAATAATPTVTTGTLSNNVITAASINAAALNGKGDWNIGKTGYALSSAGVQAIWDALTSALTTAGSIGKLLVDNVNASISAIKTQTDKLTFTVANQIDANVLDWKSSTAPAMTGDAYARLGAPAGASVSADVAAAKVDTVAIKTKTDQLTFTVANQVDSNAESMNATTINGTGTSGDLWRGA